MRTDISGELGSRSDTIAVSARAKEQIGSEASAAKVRSEDPKFQGSSFWESFPDTAPAGK